MGVLDGVLGYMSQERTNQKNQELQQAQNEYNLKMWKLNNEYNDPSNQVLRMKAAGLNPADVTKNGGAMQAGNSSGPALAAPLIPNADPMQAAGNFSSAISQARNLMQDALYKRDTRKLRVAQVEREVENLRLVADGMGLDNAYKQIINSYADSMQLAALNLSKSSTNVNDKQAAYLDKQYEIANETLTKVIPQQLKESNSRIELNAADFALVTQEFEVAIRQASLLEEQSKTEQERQKEIGAQTGLLESQSALTDSQKELTDVKKETETATVAQLKKSYEMYCDTYEDLVAQTANRTKLSNREVKAFWVNLLLHGGTSAAETGKSVASTLATVAKFMPK